MKRKFTIIIIAIVIMAGFENSASAQTSGATLTGSTAGVKLIVPMTLAKIADLHFGTINVLSGAGGTCILPSSSTTRIFGTGLAGSAIAPLPTNASYSVTGTKNTTYALTLPNTINVTETLGSATMTISSLKIRFNGTTTDAITPTSTLSPTGTDSFTLGGTLTVGVGQTGGIYAGTFDVSVDYN